MDCDRAAKAFLWELAYFDKEPEVPSTIHQEGWTCWINGVKMTTDHPEAVRFEISSKAIKKHLDNKGHLPKETFDYIDWEITGCAMKRFPPLFWLWVTKHVSGHCGVGQHMKLRGEWDSDQCPCCEEVEHPPHMVVCEDSDQVEVWEEAVTNLAEWFVATKTDPAIMECVCDALTPRSTTMKFADFASDSIIDVVEEQDEMGWMNFVEG